MLPPQGYASTFPDLRNVCFRKDRMYLHFGDGRELSVPLERFPAIAALTPAQRRGWTVISGIGIAFPDTEEMVHVSQFLGEDNSVRKWEEYLAALPDEARPAKALRSTDVALSHPRVATHD